MRRTRVHTIYRYRKTKRKKNITNKYIYLPFSPVLFFLVFGILSFIFFSPPYLLNNKNKSEHFAYTSIAPSLQMFHKDIKTPKNTSPKLPLLISLLSSMGDTLTPTPKPKPVVQIPVAQANEEEQNGYCLNVPVLLYHHIQPLSIAQKLGHAQLTVDSNSFDTQMAYLAANNYHAISAEELANALIGHHALPAKSIVVTIDDGYDDNYTYAFQILKKYNITGNFMIPTGLIGNNGYMSWEELKEISENSLMHVYNHTWSHSALGGQTQAKIEYEVTTAQNQLESNLGKAVKILTYPYGSFSPLVIDILKKEGFTAAFSTIGGTMQCDSYIFALRRIHIGSAPLTSYGL